MLQKIIKTMENLNTNYNIKLEILTPVHIGGGKEKDWSKGIDFVHHEGKIYVLDQERVFLDLLENQKEGSYLAKINSGNLVNLETFILHELGDNLEDYATKIIDSDMPESASEIHSLIRNGQGKPYIPGSSIKGALASVIANYLSKNSSQKETNHKKLLGEFSESIMRYIRPSDFTLAATEVHKVKLFNLYNYGTTWKSKFKEVDLNVESFAVGSQGEFRLSIADGLLQFIKEQETKQRNLQLTPTNHKHIIKNNTIQHIFNQINNYSYTFLEKEIKFFEKYPQVENTQAILNKLYDLQLMTIHQKRTCVFRLASGSGFYGITGDLRFENHLDTIENPDKMNMVYSQTERTKVPARYKSRKIIGDNLMGYVQLTLPDGVADIEFTEKIGVDANPKQYFFDTSTKKQLDKSPETTTISQPIITKPIVNKIEVAFDKIDNNTEFTAKLVQLSPKKVLLHIENQQLTADLVVDIFQRQLTFELNEVVKVKVNQRSGDNRIIQVKLI